MTMVYILVYSKESYDEVACFNRWIDADNFRKEWFDGKGRIYERIIIGGK